jgi:hypothetical protein
LIRTRIENPTGVTIFAKAVICDSGGPIAAVAMAALAVRGHG